jgi:hypothetical protein
MRASSNIAIALALIATASVPERAKAADVVNGWSTHTTIAEVYSVYSLTMFKLNGVADGCGHPSYWQLPLTDTVASKTKIALIAAAFASGKTVSLRCENSYVSDFSIRE